MKMCCLILRRDNSLYSKYEITNIFTKKVEK